MANNIRVSPTEPFPTHHISLETRGGDEIGLILCDDKGNAVPTVNLQKFAIETTALKQTSGSSSYSDFDYPYAPIVQDDLSGGRGSIDFERDSTKYYDSFRCKSGRANKAYAGPQEQFPLGVRAMDQNVPGDVTWKELTGTSRYIYRRFQASASYTAGHAWILARRKGTPGNLTITIYADTAGAIGSSISTVNIAYTSTDDVLSEWMNGVLSAALVSGTYYWIVINATATDDSDKHWKIAVSPIANASYYGGSFVTTPITSGATFATFDLYYRLTPVTVDRTCIPYEYKEQQYFAVNTSSGVRLWMAGDRGTAVSNAGQLTKVIDTTKTWTANEHVGKTVMITDGTGRLETKPYRVIVSNTSTELVCASSDPWTIQHDTTTEYVLYGDKLTEITGHGLTAAITDVLVSTQGVIYFCMGDAVTVRRMREYTNAGVWTREYADETATTKAVFMKFKPNAQKIFIANNSDASGNVSVSAMSNASVPGWGTALTWAAAQNVDSKYRRITGMIVHPDAAGAEALWVMKTDIPYIVPNTGNPYPINLEEMRTVRSQNNGVQPMRHGVYLYFPMQQGLERYYSAQVDDIGPNLNEGLPENRRGPIIWMQAYPGKFFIAIDAGTAGYSSVMDSDGWHERYRAPKGQRIRAMAFQVTPGADLDRLWIYVGNDLIYLPFPSETVNELEDSTYPFTHEFAITFSRMHAGMFDVQKLVKKIKIQSEGLSASNYFELDYRLNEDTEWTTFDDIFKESPTQEIDLTSQFGLAAKRLQFRLRGYTTNRFTSPVFLAIIINAVLRTDVKYMYPLKIRLMDNEPLLGLREEDPMTADEKRHIIEDLADASTDSMILVHAISRLFDGMVVFLNPPKIYQARSRLDLDNPFKRDVYVCDVTLQDA